MLSAVAARKAAQAQLLAQNATNSGDGVTTETPHGPSTSKDAGMFAQSASSEGRNKRSPLESSSNDELESPTAINGQQRNSPSNVMGGVVDNSKKKKRRKTSKKARYFDVVENLNYVELPVDSMVPGNGDIYSGNEDEYNPRSASSTPPIEVYHTPVGPSPINARKAWSPSAPVMHSSSEDGDVNMEQEEGAASLKPVLPCAPAFLSTYNPNPKNLFDVPTTSSSTSKLLLLHSQQTLTPLGAFSLVVLKGELDFQGSCLTAKQGRIEIFSPRCAPLGIMTALPLNPAVSANAFELLSTDLQELITQHSGCALMISDLHTGIEGLGRVCGTFEGTFDAPSHYNGVVNIGLRTVHLVQDPHPHLQSFMTPVSWKQSIESVIPFEGDQSILKPSVFLILGPKGSGKSSFSQMLSNNLLSRYSRVALLDTDPGQPLIGPPGLISLHILTTPLYGPPFTHQAIPARAHFLGSVTPRSNVDRWMEAVEDLMHTWRLDWSFTNMEDSSEGISNDQGLIDMVVPLVINTHGWTKGYGAQLLRRLRELAEPSHVFQFPEAVSQELLRFEPNLEDEEPKDSATLVYNLEPIPSSTLSSRFTAVDFRNISILSYLHSQLPDKVRNIATAPQVTWDTTISLCEMEPWEILCGADEAIDMVYLCGPWADDVVAQEIGRVMNCAVVGLVHLNGPIETAKTPKGAIPYIQGNVVPSAESSNCIGLAFIRAVDAATAKFHILTPIPSAFFPSCRVLFKGELELPIWGFLKFGEDPGSNAPYLDWGAGKGAIGSEKRRARRNLMRRAQM